MRPRARTGHGHHRGVRPFDAALDAGWTVAATYLLPDYGYTVHVLRPRPV